MFKFFLLNLLNYFWSMYNIFVMTIPIYNYLDPTAANNKWIKRFTENCIKISNLLLGYWILSIFYSSTYPNCLMIFLHFFLCEPSSSSFTFLCFFLKDLPLLSSTDLPVCFLAFRFCETTCILTDNNQTYKSKIIIWAGIRISILNFAETYYFQSDNSQITNVNIYF